jgi:hypothetical protein
MEKRVKLFLAATLIGSSLSAGFMEDMASQIGGVLGSMPQKNTQSINLISQLSQMLNVNTQQAIGGTAALMQVASEKMPKDSYNSLLSAVPGLGAILGTSSSLSSILGSVGSENINKAFKALGMDSSMVSQFAPALLEIFKNYVDSTTLTQLSQAWQPLMKK